MSQSRIPSSYRYGYKTYEPKYVGYVVHKLNRVVISSVKVIRFGRVKNISL